MMRARLACGRLRWALTLTMRDEARRRSGESDRAFRRRGRRLEQLENQLRPSAWEDAPEAELERLRHFYASLSGELFNSATAPIMPAPAWVWRRRLQSALARLRRPRKGGGYEETAVRFARVMQHNDAVVAVMREAIEEVRRSCEHLTTRGRPLLTLTAEAPPLSEDASGAIFVGEAGVPLEAVLNAHRTGSTPEPIVERFPSVLLEDVYEAIGYCLRHPTEVECYLEASAAPGVNQKYDGAPRRGDTR